MSIKIDFQDVSELKNEEESVRAPKQNVRDRSEYINVDELLKKYVGACGIWQWGIALLAVLCAPSMATFPVFVNAIPEQRCKMEPSVEDVFKRNNLTFSQISFIIGPSKNETTIAEVGCSRFKFNWDDTNLVEELISNGSYILNYNRTALQTEHCKYGYVYQAKEFQYTSTIIAEFDLVCEYSWLAPTGTSLFMVGMLLGFVFGGLIGDKFGRRYAAIGFSIMEVVAAVGVSVAPNHHIYHLMRTIIGFTNTGKASVLRIIPIEITLAKYRSYFTSLTILGIVFFHRAILAGVAYLVRDWRYLNIIVMSPCLFSFLFFWFLPESPRWLISQFKIEEALKVLRTGCQVNHFFLRDKSKLEEFDRMIVVLMKSQVQKKKQKSSQITLKRICCDLKTLLKQTILNVEISSILFICILLFMGQSFGIFGVLLYGKLINSSVYLVAFINATMAIPGPLVASLTYRIFRYRRKPLMCVYFISWISLLSGGLYTILGKPESDIVLIICSNCALIMYSASMIMLLIYVAELFPSNMRTRGIGISAGFGRIGSIGSTFVNQMETNFGHGIPIIVYSCSAFVQIILLYFLRDTTGENLLDTENNKQLNDKNQNKEIINVTTDQSNSHTENQQC